MYRYLPSVFLVFDKWQILTSISLLNLVSWLIEQLFLWKVFWCVVRTSQSRGIETSLAISADGETNIDVSSYDPKHRFHFKEVPFFPKYNPDKNSFLSEMSLCTQQWNIHHPVFLTKIVLDPQARACNVCHKGESKKINFHWHILFFCYYC